jgi:hypothetical protein
LTKAPPQASEVTQPSTQVSPRMHPIIGPISCSVVAPTIAGTESACHVEDSDDDWSLDLLASRKRKYLAK